MRIDKSGKTAAIVESSINIQIEQKKKMAKTKGIIQASLLKLHRTAVLGLNKASKTINSIYLFIKSGCLKILELKNKYWEYDLVANLSHYTKKYLYTINHKRIALNYLYFSIVTGLAGAMLASFIRLELSYPGSHFFKGDSIRYIQVISAHGLIMIFYVVVPIIFGFFANYFIPYHILSKDVAFPRLNSIGFWLLPAGFLMMSRPAFVRRQVYKVWDPYEAYQSIRKDLLKNFKEIMDSGYFKESVEQFGFNMEELQSSYFHRNLNRYEISELIRSIFNKYTERTVNEVLRDDWLVKRSLSNTNTVIKNLLYIKRINLRSIQAFYRYHMGSNTFSIRDFILNGVEENIRYNERVNRGRTIVSVLAPSIRFHMGGIVKEAVQDTHFLFIRDHRKGKVCDLFWNNFFVKDWAAVTTEFKTKELMKNILVEKSFASMPRELLKTADRVWGLRENTKVVLGDYGEKYNRYNSVFLDKKILFARAGLHNELPNCHMYFGLQNQLKGRVASEGTNKLSIDTNWTDFLMLWEYNYLWYENPWQALKNAMENKTILMRNEKCSNPAAVMSGWTFITPFSSQTRFTGFGSQDVAIVSVLFAGLSSTISFTNLLLTRRVLGAAGFKNRKNSIPFISISLFLVMRMLSLITPVLGAAMIMLLMDRHWRTSFFDYAYGGDSILFHHLFWFFGHPEVYVVVIPAFGIVNSFLPYYNKRRIASKNHLVWATYVMAYMGFLVWGHHMYLIGLDHRSRSFYSTITVMISLPAVVKIVNWTLTFLNGTLFVDIGLHFVTAFFLYFLSGGLTGLWLSHVALNLYMHDTFYVVAHFHFMFSCATFSALFAGIYFYYREIFGNKYSRVLAIPHFLCWFFGQWITFLPLYWVGYNGLPRRYHDYPVMYMGWHGISSSGHMLTMFGIFFFLFGVLKSKLIKRAVIPDQFGVPRTFKRVQYEVLKKSHLEFGKYNYNRYDILKVLDDIITR